MQIAEVPQPKKRGRQPKKKAESEAKQSPLASPPVSSNDTIEEEEEEGEYLLSKCFTFHGKYAS